MKKSDRRIYRSVTKRENESPKEIDILKVSKAPKSVIAHDAPSKKLVILSNRSFCIKGVSMLSDHQR